MDPTSPLPFFGTQAAIEDLEAFKRALGDTDPTEYDPPSPLFTEGLGPTVNLVADTSHAQANGGPVEPIGPADTADRSTSVSASAFVLTLETDAFVMAILNGNDAHLDANLSGDNLTATAVPQSATAHVTNESSSVSANPAASTDQAAPTQMSSLEHRSPHPYAEQVAAPRPIAMHLHYPSSDNPQAGEASSQVPPAQIHFPQPINYTLSILQNDTPLPVEQAIPSIPSDTVQLPISTDGPSGAASSDDNARIAPVVDERRDTPPHCPEQQEQQHQDRIVEQEQRDILASNLKHEDAAAGNTGNTLHSTDSPTGTSIDVLPFSSLAVIPTQSRETDEIVTARIDSMTSPRLDADENPEPPAIVEGVLVPETPIAPGEGDVTDLAGTPSSADASTPPRAAIIAILPTPVEQALVRPKSSQSLVLPERPSAPSQARSIAANAPLAPSGSTATLPAAPSHLSTLTEQVSVEPVLAVAPLALAMPATPVGVDEKLHIGKVEHVPRTTVQPKRADQETTASTSAVEDPARQATRGAALIADWGHTDLSQVACDTALTIPVSAEQRTADEITPLAAALAETDGAAQPKGDETTASAFIPPALLSIQDEAIINAAIDNGNLSQMLLDSEGIELNWADLLPELLDSAMPDKGDNTIDARMIRVNGESSSSARASSPDSEEVDTSLLRHIDGIAHYLPSDRRFRDRGKVFPWPGSQRAMWQLRQKLSTASHGTTSSWQSNQSDRTDLGQRDNTIPVHRKNKRTLLEPVPSHSKRPRTDGSRDRPSRSRDLGPSPENSGHRKRSRDWAPGDRLTPPRSGMPKVPMRTRSRSPVPVSKSKSKVPERETIRKKTGTCPTCKRPGMSRVRDNKAASGQRLEEAIDLTVDSD